MTTRTLSHAFQTVAPDPVAKLVLIMFSENCDDFGYGPMTFHKWAASCSMTPEEVGDAVARLVDAGCLSIHGSELCLQAGYEGPSDDVSSPSRKKISVGTRLRVYERDGYICKKCGDQRGLTIDHIKPWSKGGAHDESNFQTLCRSCNLSKGARYSA